VQRRLEQNHRTSEALKAIERSLGSQLTTCRWQSLAGGTAQPPQPTMTDAIGNDRHRTRRPFLVVDDDRDMLRLSPCAPVGRRLPRHRTRRPRRPTRCIERPQLVLSDVRLRGATAGAA
jgi:hypothetical protein